MTSKKIRLFIPVLVLIVAILACESSEDTKEQVITATEEIKEPTQTKPVNTPTPKFTSTPSPQGYATVTAKLCNLRSGPGTDYSIKGSVEKGEVVPIYGKSSDSYWLLIDNSHSIWIAASLIDVDVDIASLEIVDIASLSSSESDSPYVKTDIAQELPTVDDVEAALTCDEIYKQHKDLTDIQWKEYVNIIAGKPIEYTGSITEVKTNGSIEISACGYFDHVTFTVYGIPADIALTLPKFSDVMGSGTISQVYRKNVIFKGLFSTSLKEWLYINVYGTLEVLD